MFEISFVSKSQTYEHFFQYEPIVTPGNEHNVHHMIVSRCNGSYPHLDMKTAICDDSKNEMDDWPSDCGQFALWAVGGGVSYILFFRSQMWKGSKNYN